MLSADTLVVSGLVFVSQERGHISTEPNVQSAPDLVVEVISPSSITRDQETRRDLYAKYKVPYYSLVHPTEHWDRAYELGKAGLYELVAEGRKDDAFSTPPFPDLTIQLSGLWDDL